MHDDKFYFHYFWRSGLHLHLASGFLETPLALILCPQWGPAEVLFFQPAARPLQVKQLCGFYTAFGALGSL